MKKLLTICLIMSTVFSVNAQDKEPTISETLSFIKLKTLEKAWFFNEGDVTTVGCVSKNFYYVDGITSINLSETSKKFNIYYKCEGDKGELVINLDKIEAIEHFNDKFYLRSTTPLVNVTLNDKTIETKSKFLILIYTKDAERLAKAFKHLLKQLNIDLVDSKF